MYYPPFVSPISFYSPHIFIIALFILGQAAGRQEAQDVLARQARQVKVFFTKDFAAHLATNLTESEANQRLEAIRNASENNALALIWRSSSETIFLLFGTQGDHHGRPLEIFRVGNSPPQSLVSVGIMSIDAATSEQTEPAGIFPGHIISVGSRMPPS